MSGLILIGEASCPISMEALDHAVGRMIVLSLDACRRKCGVRMGSMPIITLFLSDVLLMITFTIR